MKDEYIKKIKLPDKSGVYFFLGRLKEGKNVKEIIYIGKATSLRDRVKSYFGKDLIETRGPLLVDMLFQADKIDWQETDSVLEALILEASLIKKYQPKYNTKEKSDKSFNYVCITKEVLPKILVIRGKGLNVKHRMFDRVYGPFPNGSQLKEALRIIRIVFPYLDDKSKNYAEFYRQINLAPNLADKKMYLQNIKNIKLFFQGKKKQIKKNLKKEMLFFAKEKKFEEASEIKRQIFALEHINDVALLKGEHSASYNFSSLRPSQSTGRDPRELKITESSVSRIEAYDIAHMGGKNMVGVMTVVEDGQVAKHEYKKFKIRTQNNANDTGALIEVLERRFTHSEWTYPRLVIVDGSTAQINAAKKVLNKFGIEIPVVSVVKNDRHKPIGIKGDASFAKKHEKDILLANSEAHRFAIAYHKKTRNKNFLKMK